MENRKHPDLSLPIVHDIEHGVRAHVHTANSLRPQRVDVNHMESFGHLPQTLDGIGDFVKDSFSCTRHTQLIANIAHNLTQLSQRGGSNDD